MSDLLPQADIGDSSDRRMARIAHAVLDLIREGGLGAVTTDAVAANAEVSKATIYRYWRNKTALLIAAASVAITFPEVPDRGSLREELRELLMSRLTTYLSPGNDRLWAALIGASAEDPQFGTTLRGWIETQMQTNAAIIRRGIRRGELREDVSVADVATMVGAPLVYRLTLQSTPPNEALIEMIVECVASGLGPAARATAGGVRGLTDAGQL